MIAVPLLGGALLVACVRHSWLAQYNYPDMNRMQSRYLIGLGILFLITACVILKQFPLKKPGLAQLLGFSLIPAALAILSYQIIIKGEYILDKRIVLSINSADGDLFKGLGVIFLIISIGIILITNMVIGKSNQIALLYALLGIGVIYLSGISPVYKNLLTRQENNFPIKAASFQLMSDFPTAQADQSRFTILYNPWAKPVLRMDIVVATFNVYGFYNLKLVVDSHIAKDKKKEQILIVQKGHQQLFTIYRFTNKSKRYNNETRKNTVDGIYFFALEKDAR
jgi:hypothetical protein